VEHPVTELVTGVDLVQWQIRIARGERLTLDPDAVLTPRGHAIECRIYAEDADSGFLPSPGRITLLRTPEGPGIRNDSGVDAGGEVPIFYDPMVSKLIAWGEDRAQATTRMLRALREYEVHGIRTTVPFFRWMLGQEAFRDAEFTTNYLDELLQQRRGEAFSTPEATLEEVAAIAAALRVAARESRSASTVSPSAGWKQYARIEGLRG
jgi:acetyl-CoA carboxylase biotin carboxylase subunit